MKITSLVRARMCAQCLPLKSSGRTAFGISNALFWLEKWEIRYCRDSQPAPADTRVPLLTILYRDRRVLMAFSKTQEREQTEFSNRPQPIDGKLGATIIGPT